MPADYLTYAVIFVGVLSVVLGLLWPANARRWGTERTMPADPAWEPWAFLPPVGDETPPADAVYRVGEVIETMVRPQIGDGR